MHEMYIIIISKYAAINIFCFELRRLSVVFTSAIIFTYIGQLNYFEISHLSSSTDNNMIIK